MITGKQYTVHELAALSGVSVRTLHYYDEIDLLSPARVLKNGYRVYEEKELLRLQQVLFFRELDFALEDIKKMLNRKDFAIVSALKEHKTLLRAKQKRIDNLLKTIDKTIAHMTTHNKIEDEELYDAFKDPDVAKYQDEVKERWGNTEAYKQSQAKVRTMTKTQMAELKKAGDVLNKKLAAAMDFGADSVEAQALIAEHYKGICFFYDCPKAMYKNLGEMYVNDSRFTATYEKYRPGMAVFMRDAIAVFCSK